MKQPASKSRTAAKPAAKPAPKAAIKPVLKDVTPASDTTAAFLREVDEAMQQERLLAIWHQSKWFILAGVLALLLAIAGLQTWDAWREHQARTLAAQWYAFSELKTDSARVKELPALLQSTTGGTHALAVFMQAAMQHTGPEKAKAYNQITTNTSNPQWLRDLARLNGAIALMGDHPQEAKAQLEILAQANVEQLPSPAYAPALELLALLAQQSNDIAAAKGYTEKLLQQPGLPADMRQRALQRYGALGGASS